MKITCYFRRLGYTDCSGRIDPAHWIPQQRIKDAFRKRGATEDEIKAVLDDDRNISPACRQHHGAFDRKLLPVELASYPPTVLEFADDHGFFWNGPREGFLALALDRNSCP